ncbi:MAG: DUF4157 domain-containing protein [Nostoc sp. JL34]|uniref:eCIS core domain-containing protein n=1 Tax=Nostoc sp. JL34 TaxID=2815397 RepID=UPI001DA228C9|nr:DUF4157 domain-containing protein [Nostoc sp. JL34]MBN3884850.1 DUF4157 domain-containing protein [Nostoc sp. JL34]
MTTKRIAQTNQERNSEKSQGSGILQRAAVRSVLDAEVQSKEDKEAQPLSNSALYKDFSRVPISTTKPQQIMAKLTIGAVGDKYEQEADRVAAQVVQRINASASVRSGEDETVQREEMETKDNKARLMRLPILQRRSSNGGMTATPDLEASINRTRGGGRPMENNVRKRMEQGFGADFSKVKIHTDAQSNQLNRSIGARAFTTGRDVFFRQGEYNPGSRKGDELVAHELAHTIQQSGLTDVASTKEVIQRAVGFEFEITDYEVTNQNGERIPKKEVIQQGHKFSLQGEDKGTERSCIEFVTDPPGYNTEEELTQSMTDMVALAQRLQQQQGQGNIPIANGQYLIQPNNFQAHVQASVGVPLESLSRLYALMEDTTNDKYYRAPRLRGARSAYVAQKTMNNPPSYELVGFLTLLSDYLISGGGYEKRPITKGLFRIMARTDFTTMFSSLPQQELNYFLNNLEDWLVIVLAGAPSEKGSDPTKAIINQSFSYDDDFLINPDKKGEKIGVSRGHWLASMRETDLLREGTHHLIESMGSLGSRRDRVTTWGGLTEKDAPIFELRNLSIPGTPDNWVRYALNVWEMVKQANEDPKYSQEFHEYSYETDDPNSRPSQDKLKRIRDLAEKCTDMNFLL